MRYIEDLRNKYREKEIWILGTGPSVDDYPEDFFQDKITIALKYAVKAFPHYTYSLSNLRSLKMRTVIEKNPHLYKTHIYVILGEGSDVFPKGEYRNHPIYMQSSVFRYYEIKSKNVRTLLFRAIDAIAKEKSINYPGLETISHYAIEAAAVLGAKKITLAGCEDKCRKYGCYTKRVFWFYYKPYQATGQKKIRKAGHKVPKGGYSDSWIENYWKEPVLKAHRKGTRWLAEALKLHGVELALYHYKDSKQYKAGYLGLA